MSCLIGFLIAGAVLLLNRNDPGKPITIIPAPTPLPIQVYISGEIDKPGVYELPSNSRLEDLIILANIPLMDVKNLNLSSKLYDGQHIQISTSPIDNKGKIIETDETEKININEATMEDLISLPGIGESKANEIILYRESHGYFDTIEDILNVPGIGEAIFNRLKDMIVTNSLN